MFVYSKKEEVKKSLASWGPTFIPLGDSVGKKKQAEKRHSSMRDEK